MTLIMRACFYFWIILLAIHYSSTSYANATKLQPNFYNTSCPKLEPIVQSAVAQAMKNDQRIPASLVRLFFHDCFVQGCDASILLDDSPNLIISEKNAPPNANSVRGYELVDNIKAQLEHHCPATVSCADIIAIAARDATFLSGGPSWPVLLGRRDSLTANTFLANQALPSPFLNLSVIIHFFTAQGLDATDLVALSGAHTFGRARCSLFSYRLYNSTTGMPDPTMDTSYADNLRRICPKNGDPDTLVDLETSTPNSFDNHYFQELTKSRGLLQSDQELFSFPNASTKAIVQSFSENQTLFFHQFGLSMVKLGNINPLTGSSGEIRRNCRMVN